MTIGLLIPALLGSVIALTNPTKRRTAILVLAVGAILPLMLLLV